MSDNSEKLQSEINSLKEKIKKGRKDKNDITMKDYLSQNNVSIKQGSDFKLRRTLKGHLGKVYALQWADDSTNIVSASQDGNLLVWNALTTNKVTAIPLRSHWVMTCAYAPGGQFVASGGLDNICSIFNLQSKSFPIQVTRELQHHEGFVSCCRFVTDAKQIVTASGDKTCILWDVEGGNTTTIFEDMEGPIMSIAVHQSGNFFLAAGSEEKKDSGSSFVRVLDLRSGKCQRLVQPHEKDVNWVEFFPDGNAFVTASEDRTLKLFDLRADDEIMTYKHDSINANVTSATFSASGRYLFAGYEDGRCIQWNTLTGAAEYQLGGHTKRVSCVSVCKNGNALATGCWDTHLRIYTGE